MNSKYDFDKLFRTAPQQRSLDNDLFRKSALIFDFDMEVQFGLADPEQVELIRMESKQKMNGKYFLPDSTRKKIITDVIGFDNIENEIKRFGIADEYNTLLLKVIRNEELDIDALHDNELYYLSKLTSLFPGRLDTTSIKYELRRRYHFVPFRQITKNFAGRNKELDQVNEYIDWLPKKGSMNNISAWFRNVVNWHDKHPLIIQGIGGIGKSTLISKIIVDNNDSRRGETLPFIYIDFDIPGFSLSEPMTVLLEGLRQIAYQFPAHRQLLDEICRQVSDMVYGDSPDLIRQVNVSSKSQRVKVYHTIDDLISAHSYNLEDITSPVLVVFDSFEEVQYRASRDELTTFFSFIREVSERIPRIRPVFVGRSEINESLGDIKFESIELKDFDRDSVHALLEKYEIGSSEMRNTIFDTFGGNPLLLILAANLAKKDPSALYDGKQVTEKKEEYLVNRILEHIHNVEVRQIAVPGMLVRRITPGVIQDILAVPCGIGEISDERANEIFKELSKEVALISKSLSPGEIVFRQDLRIACEGIISEKYPDKASGISRRAIEYYHARKDDGEVYEAEYYFHLMKKGIELELLTKEVYMRLRNWLESAIVEFPEKSKLHIRSLLGSRVDQKIVDRTTDIEWANYYIPQIKQGLNGNLDFIRKIDKEISKRKYGTEVENSEFTIFFALLNQRLNNLVRSNEIIDRFIQSNATDSYSNTAYRLLCIKVQNLEYDDKLHEAEKICDEIVHNANYETDRVHAVKFKELRSRLAHRIQRTIGLEEARRGMMVDDVSWSEGFTDSTWINILLNERSGRYLDNERFTSAKKNYERKSQNLEGLEAICLESTGVFLKDITIAGVFEIVLQDFLYILEARNMINATA